MGYGYYTVWGWADDGGQYGERAAGYLVVATCDAKGCGKEINRGLGYLCGRDPHGPLDEGPGCGRYFCGTGTVRVTGRPGSERVPCPTCIELPDGDPAMNDALLTPEEAAARLGVTVTAERRTVPRGNVDPLVATLARISRQIAAREAAERMERRATMELVQGGRGKEGEAA